MFSVNCSDIYWNSLAVQILFIARNAKSFMSIDCNAGENMQSLPIGHTDDRLLYCFEKKTQINQTLSINIVLANRLDITFQS